MNTRIVSFLCVIIVSVVSAHGPAFADQHQSSTSSCMQYQSFLEGDNFDDLSGCDERTIWLMENHDLPVGKFLREYKGLVGERSMVRWNVGVLESMLIGSPSDTLSIANTAGLLSYYVLLSRGDQDRAEIYTAALHSIELQAAASVCGEARECQSLLYEAQNALDPIYSLGISGLEIQPYVILRCITKMDNYRAPIGSIISSPQFEICIFN